ncbi:membrane protein [Salinimicrobium marinum]|uniref:Membrane protein n=1 Tax=Salinimicrobium marinum TaxID=680283 RepID=A0A918VUF2_9FLAO|nr:OmpH family outer membrane protein [Salinimicrobium marinum]GHA24489.1 membrane protein [Salinimicrobium marinum]
MKQFKTLVLALALTFGATAFTNAQSKVAHIASQELIEQMPEYTSAMNQLEKLQKTYDTEIKDMVSEAQNTMKRYEAEAQTKTDEENSKRANELQQTQRTIGEYRQNAMQELQNKEMELLRPVMEKARTTIQKVAREKGYDYVLDSTTGTGLIMADGYDLMPDVKKSLGI